jgi:CHAD domain-containing protein
MDGMAFHLKMVEGVEEGLRRIAIAQIDGALEAADDHGARQAAPHTIRKRCKKLRGLLRLVRGAFGDYEAEQGALRDTARKLASVREAGAHLEAMQRLCARDPARYQGHDFEHASTWLQAQRDTAVRANEEDEGTEQARAMLGAQRERATQWTLQETGFDAVRRGLRGTYRSARQALALARDQPSAHHLHELRKQVKYHRFHLDLLHKSWPGPMKAAGREAHALGEILGEHHDIDVLLAALGQGHAGRDINDAGERIAVAARPERERLEQAAFHSARCLLAEKPGCFGKRLQRYWEVRK